MVKVRKRSGLIEEFIKSKIIRGCRKAGASAKEAAKVAEDITRQVAKMTVVSTGKMAELVVASLKKVNKTAADAFVRFRRKKYKK